MMAGVVASSVWVRESWTCLEQLGTQRVNAESFSCALMTKYTKRQDSARIANYLRLVGYIVMVVILCIPRYYSFVVAYGMQFWVSFSPGFGEKNTGPARTTKFLNLPASFHKLFF